VDVHDFVIQIIILRRLSQMTLHKLAPVPIFIAALVTSCTPAPGRTYGTPFRAGEVWEVYNGSLCTVEVHLTGKWSHKLGELVPEASDVFHIPQDGLYLRAVAVSRSGQGCGTNASANIRMRNVTPP
jgi:hypothetical protein